MTSLTPDIAQRTALMLVQAYARQQSVVGSKAHAAIRARGEFKGMCNALAVSGLARTVWHVETTVAKVSDENPNEGGANSLGRHMQRLADLLVVEMEWAA